MFWCPTVGSAPISLISRLCLLVQALNGVRPVFTGGGSLMSYAVLRQ